MPDTTHAHTQEPGAKKEPFPPFQPENFASQLFWLALMFVVLYVVMARLALPRIGGILEARRRRIADDLEAAQKLREQSEAALAAYEKALADARGRAQAIANETHQRLAAESEERRKVLEAELSAQLVEAEKTIEVAKSAAMANVRAIAAETAAAIVERLIGSAPTPKLVDAAVDETLKR